MATIFTATLKQSMTGLLKYMIDMMSQVSSSADRGDTETSKTIKQLYISISKDGLEMFTNTQKIVVACATLSLDVFSEYEYNDDEDDLCVGVSLDIIKSFFKNVNKTDHLTMKISNDNNYPNTIAFVLNETKGFSIKFNLVQNIDNDAYDEYIHVVDIPSSRYNNLYREVGGVKRQVMISFNDDRVTLSSNMVDIAENWVQFLSVGRLESPPISIKSDYIKMTSKLSHFADRVSMSVDPETNILLSTSHQGTNIRVVVYREKPSTTSTTTTRDIALSITDSVYLCS